MIRATTPTFNLAISGDVDLTVADGVWVSIVQSTTTIELTDDALEVGAKTISCWLTQEQSLRLVPGLTVKIQVNWTYTDSDGNKKRAATNIQEFGIGDNLIRRVLL